MSKFPLPLRLCLALTLAGCATGPNFIAPESAAPDDWTTWRSSDAQLRTSLSDSALLKQWWQAYNDPLLDRLEQRALDASPDLKTAALHYAQARVQRSTTAAQQGPEISASGGVNRQRQSENGAGTRLIDVLGGDRPELKQMLAAPFTLYQAGIDASWEPDFWGRVSRSLEAADADLASRAALLDLARLSLAADLVQHYFDLRSTQAMIAITREDIATQQQRLHLLEQRQRSGVIDDFDPQRQRTDLAALQAQLPPLQAQEGTSINQIALLLGATAGDLRAELAAAPPGGAAILPHLAMGLPSEVALRRPDIRAATARLHGATANIGIAQADLYPSIRLGARFGYESYLSGELKDWGSRSWSVGPSLNLPLFDRGRRKSVVQLRELEQQEAAINYHQTVRKAWGEIDDALSGYAAEQQQKRALDARLRSAQDVLEMARARYQAGTTDFISVLDSQRSVLQARRDQVSSDGRLKTRFATINRAVGNI